MNKPNTDNFVLLAPELARMAQIRARETGGSARAEIARTIACQWVAEQEQERMMLDGDVLAMSDNLFGTLGVNDICIDGKRFDVRPLLIQDDKSGSSYVEIDRALVNTPYLANGSLIVKLDGLRGGQIVAAIKSGAYMAASEKTAAKDDALVVVPVEVADHFDPLLYLQDMLGTLARMPQINVQPAKPNAQFADELRMLLDHDPKLSQSKARAVVAHLVSHWSDKMQGEVDELKMPQSKKILTRTLSRAAFWHARVERTVERVIEHFPDLDQEPIRQAVLVLGERFGGETTAPKFKNELCNQIADIKLASYKAADAARQSRAKDVFARVMAGAESVATIRDLLSARSQAAFAIDMATKIKKGREKLSQNVIEFVSAGVDEIGKAFQEMSLAPAYATHSSSGSTDETVETIDEALQLMAVGDLAHNLRQLSKEL